ncbi:HEAT repeat domain-containing protein [Methanosarcina sp.]|uniref:HEAT repeat domain-containing protein n=1 Tax=Methanosarcina sp. TaxID=2213 RepID=UPI003C721FEB
MMSGVKWRVSLLFVLITLSIFFSLLANSDRFMEVRGNETYPQTGSGVSSEDLILNLTNRLEAGNHETRLSAAAELGKFRGLAANGLIERIESNLSSSEKVNSYMLLALLETGDDRAENIFSESFVEKNLKNATTGNAVEEEAQSGAAGEILQAMEAKDKTMRRNLATSLDRDYKDETNALETALKAEEQNSSVYDSVALSEFGPDEPGSETEKLLKALKSDSGNIRVAALMALGERKEVAAIDPITGILVRDYPPVQSSAVFALGEIGDEGAVDILLERMKDGENPTIRSNAAIALGKIGKETTVPNLIDRLRDNSIVVRSSAALSLGKIGNEAAVEPLIEVLNSGKLSGGRAKDSLNSNEDLRKSAVLALGGIGSPEATETLTGILNDKEEMLSVRMAAVSALGGIGDPQAVQTLKSVFDNKSIDVNLRKQAFFALSQTRNQEVAGLLVAKLGDTEFGASARGALKNMEGVAVDPLIENLKTTDKKTKDETALLLIEIGDPKAIKPLILAYQ